MIWTKNFIIKQQCDVRRGTLTNPCGLVKTIIGSSSSTNLLIQCNNCIGTLKKLLLKTVYDANRFLKIHVDI